MTVWFATRHAGAREWALRQGIEVDHQVDHLDIEHVNPGDTVIGSLPVHLAAAICEREARYLHLILNVPSSARGRELTADEMAAFGARLQTFRVERLES